MEMILNVEDQIIEKFESILFMIFSYTCKLHFKNIIKYIMKITVFIILIYDRIRYFDAQYLLKMNHFCPYYRQSMIK